MNRDYTTLDLAVKGIMIISLTTVEKFQMSVLKTVKWVYHSVTYTYIKIKSIKLKKSRMGGANRTAR